MHTYIDGQLAATVKGAQLSRDGQHACKRRLALFWDKEADYNPGAFVYVRSVAVHSLALDAEQVRKEHAVLHQLLVEDAIASTPSFMQQPLTASHAEAPFANTKGVRRKLTALVRRGFDLGTEAWRLLQAHGEASLKSFQQRLEPSQAPSPPPGGAAVGRVSSRLVCCQQVELLAKWRIRSAGGAVEPRDESTPPFGETLAHACGYAGATGLLGRLLASGASADLVRRRGVASGFTALHAAVAGGQLEACAMLLAAGAKPNSSSASRRSALWTACVKGHREVALPPRRSAPSAASRLISAVSRLPGGAAPGRARRRRLRRAARRRVAGRAAVKSGLSTTRAVNRRRVGSGRPAAHRQQGGDGAARRADDGACGGV